MDASSSTSSSERAAGPPVAALAALALIAMLELWIGSRPDLFADGLYRTTAAKRDIVADRSRRDDVLVFGNSRVFSIRPEVVDAALGGDVHSVNLSWPFMGADAYDMVLSVYLREHSKPRMILVDAFPELVALRPEHLSLADLPIHRTRLYTDLPAGPLASELVARRDWSLLFGLATQLCMPPSLRWRDRVRDGLQSLAHGEPIPGPRPIDVAQVEGMARHGAYLMYLDTEATRAVFLMAQRQNDFAVRDNPAAIAAYERFLERADAADIRVRVLGVPLPATTYDLYEELGILTAYRALLERLRAAHPSFDVIEPVLTRWPDERFGDAGHLNRPGDAVFQDFCREMLERSGLGRELSR